MLHRHYFLLLCLLLLNLRLLLKVKVIGSPGKLSLPTVQNLENEIRKTKDLNAKCCCFRPMVIVGAQNLSVQSVGRRKGGPGDHTCMRVYMCILCTHECICLYATGYISCLYTYIYICVYIYIYTHICICIHAGVSMYKYKHIHVHDLYMFACVCRSIHDCVHAHAGIHKCTYTCMSTYAYMYNTCIHLCMYVLYMICMYLYVLYIYMVTRSAAPPTPPNGLGSPPSSVVWCLVGVSPPSFSLYGVGYCGWESPFVLPPCGVESCGWEGIPSFSTCGVGSGGWESPALPLFVVWGLVGRVRAGRSWWARGGREASLVRQTIFCGRRFCSETLGCPFKCFGRPWRFLLGTIQYRAIKSVLTTSRPPIIDYTLCHILYTIYSRLYIIYYKLYSV